MVVFEELKKISNQSVEFWSARDIARELGYSEYRHFLPVIKKAKISCKNSDQSIKDHFEDFLDMIELGKTVSKKLTDYQTTLDITRLSF